MLRLFNFCNTHRTWCVIGILLLVAAVFGTHSVANDARTRYENLLSPITYDRNSIPVVISANTKGLYVLPIEAIPPDFAEILVKKEDRYFYYHPGVNPLSMLRGAFGYLKNGNAGGASTITQQLTKNLLGTESKRTLSNKFRESLYAVCLELYTSKETILRMYANTVFLGNQVQGFGTASRAYFNTTLFESTLNERLALLATLSHPSTRNPWEEENAGYAAALGERLGITDTYVPPTATESYSFQHPLGFELRTAGIACEAGCVTTVDAELTEVLRVMLALRIEQERARGARNGAIVVIDAKTSELIALVGSPNPKRTEDGGQINMALEPRPIGSTVKPFIYLRGFTAGLRPYTIVDDREYKYPIATGFPLYPKNFDGTYHGDITLHEALSNSLNVPSVKVLEYVRLSNFYRFLDESLAFKPVQPYESYQYGIALGGLEMDLLTLTHYFTIFPRYGTIAPLRTRMSAPQPDLPPQSHITEMHRVAAPEYIELVHAIISDRLTGVNQFGLKSNLNLSVPEYAVKTGTSRDFHDSWVVGYTPDYVVGVWIGNSENEPLEQVTGQSGAGTIWHDVMEYMKNTPYYRTESFKRETAHRISIDNSEEWGLPDDVVEEHRNLLLTDRLITSPHDGDTFSRDTQSTIPLRSRVPVTWSINGNVLETSDAASFIPDTEGTFEISAADSDSGRTEYITVTVTATP